MISAGCAATGAGGAKYCSFDPHVLAKRSNTVAGEKVTLRFHDKAIEGEFPCDSVDLSHPFFLRLHANATRGEPASSSEANTSKFAFRSKATSIELNELRYGKCAFQFETEVAPASLTVGQFSDESGSAEDWKEDFQRPATR